MVDVGMGRVSCQKECESLAMPRSCPSDAIASRGEAVNSARLHWDTRYKGCWTAAVLGMA